MRYMALITVPAAVGMAIVAADFVNVCYTPAGCRAFPVMWVLALDSMLLALSFNISDVYKIVRRPSILSFRGAVKLMVAVPAPWVAAGQGILAVAISHAVTPWSSP